jgi:uncharacterized protein YozE (UPF0346 family)
MKKFLSLVLALVMTMSLVTVSASAKEFTDDDSITYDEAVAVISEIGVVDGYEDGSFGPTATLTRQAAAKIICNLILGPTTAAELSATVAPFPDVPASSQFAGYIAYCAKEGIISGYANGNFGPGNTLTGYAFMKMLLGALGYRADIEGYNDPNTWAISVAKQAIGIGLNASLKGEFVGQKAVTREEACLYAFNTLKADLVEYNTVVNANVNGTQVTVGNLEATAQKWSSSSSATRMNNIKNDEYIQFAEQYFNKLVLTEEEDDFGQPSRNWEYKGKDLGTWVNFDQMVQSYTTKVTGLDLYTLLGKNVIDDYKITVFVDGVQNTTGNAPLLGGVNSDTSKTAYFTATDLNKNNNKKVGLTGDGVLTRVFVDTDEQTVNIAIINTYLAKANADYNSKTDEASFAVYGISKKSDEFVKTLTDDEDVYTPVKVSAEDISAAANVLEDEIYRVNIAAGEIKILEKAEIIEAAEITEFTLGDSVTVDGTKYKYAAAAEYDFEVLDEYTNANTQINLKDLTYNIYLDAYGNLLGIDLVEDPNNYVFITGVDKSSSNLSAKNYTANAIFLDGTMSTITVKSDKSTNLDALLTSLETNNAAKLATVNSWFTYTLDSDNVYTVSLVSQNGIGKSANPTGTVSDDTSVKVAQYHADTTAAIGNVDTTTNVSMINKKNISLPGRALSDGSYTRVYGNDSSVYLTASIKEIRTSTSGQTAIIIDDVDSVSVGVKNTDINVWDAAHTELANANSHITQEGTDVVDANGDLSVDDPAQNYGTDALRNGGAYSAGVYTLYKNNGYIIAAVVVGEDAAASDNLVYTHTNKIASESYDKTTGKWTWTRKVISNGEEITLTEVGDSLTYLGSGSSNGNLSKYNWYQVKYNAAGNVIGIEPAATALGATSADDTADVVGRKYASEIEDVQVCTNAYDKVLFFDTTGYTSRMSMKGNTLFVETTDTQGFYVDEDAKIVLLQTVKNDEVVTYDTGAKALESIVKNMNEQYGTSNYSYEVSAFLENGIATIVVIHDKANSYGTSAVSTDGIYANVTFPNIVTVRYTGAVPTETAEVEAIIDAIKDAGYTMYTDSELGSGVSAVTRTPNGASATYTFRAYTTLSNGSKVNQTFTWDTSTGTLAGETVTVDGQQILIREGASLAEIAAENGIDLDGTDWALITKDDGTQYWERVTTTFAGKQVKSAESEAAVVYPSTTDGVSPVFADTGISTAGYKVTKAEKVASISFGYVAIFAEDDTVSDLVTCVKKGQSYTVSKLSGSTGTGAMVATENDATKGSYAAYGTSVTASSDLYIFRGYVKVNASVKINSKDSSTLSSMTRSATATAVVAMNSQSSTVVVTLGNVPTSENQAVALTYTVKVGSGDASEAKSVTLSDGKFTVEGTNSIDASEGKDVSIVVTISTATTSPVADNT